jgi:hypothetical protein
MSDLKALLDELDALHQKAALSWTVGEGPSSDATMALEVKLVLSWPELREAIRGLLTDKELLLNAAMTASGNIMGSPEWAGSGEPSNMLQHAITRLNEVIELAARSSGESPR